jgi:hypothetical protein
MLAYRHAHGETNVQSTRGYLVFVRSYSREENRWANEPGLYWERHAKPYDAESLRRDMLSNQRPAVNFGGVTWQSIPEDPPQRREVMTLSGSTRMYQLESQRLIVPLWPVLAVALLPLLCWAPLVRRQVRLRRRRREGKCLACGYDLRASVGRCPECGAEAAVTP